jgi:hypothetical protein
MNASTIRFDSIRSRKRNRHPPRAASLPRLSRVRVRSTSSPRRASPSPASSSHPPAAASTRPGPPPTPTPRITNTHTHTGLNAPRLRKTTRCLPREIKRYPYSSISLPYTTHRYPHHTHTHVRTYGNRPSAPTRPRPRTTRSSSDCVVVARSCVRRFDRSIVRVDRDRDGLCAPRSRARVPSRRRHEASSSSRSSRSNERETDGRTERARETSSEGEEEARGWW